LITLRKLGKERRQKDHEGNKSIRRRNNFKVLFNYQLIKQVTKIRV